jgi:hypothetical protein
VYKIGYERNNSLSINPVLMFIFQSASDIYSAFRHARESAEPVRIYAIFADQFNTKREKTSSHENVNHEPNFAKSGDLV